MVTEKESHLYYGNMNSFITNSDIAMDFFHNGLYIRFDTFPDIDGTGTHIDHYLKYYYKDRSSFVFMDWLKLLLTSKIESTFWRWFLFAITDAVVFHHLLTNTIDFFIGTN